MVRRTLFLLVLGFTVATTASAGTFTVILNNGTSFLTRYRPAPADWDENVILFSTDQGNQVALMRQDIADITSSVEETGFGYQVDTTTLFVGWSPNEAFDIEDGEGGDGGAAEALAAPAASSGGGFSLEQFVDVPGSGSGISTQPVRGF